MSWLKRLFGGSQEPEESTVNRARSLLAANERTKDPKHSPAYVASNSDEPEPGGVITRLQSHQQREAANQAAAAQAELPALDRSALVPAIESLREGPQASHDSRGPQATDLHTSATSRQSSPPPDLKFDPDEELPEFVRRDSKPPSK